MQNVLLRRSVGTTTLALLAIFLWLHGLTAGSEFGRGISSSGRSGVSLPHIFGDNMVLQRDRAIPVWGKAEPSQKVTVKLAGNEAAATADKEGRWMVRLPALPAGGPFEMQVTARETVTLKNVLLGEVWIGAGQSNMEKPIGVHGGQTPCPNWQQEIASANYPEIRLMESPPWRAAAPADDFNGQWLVCSPRTIVIKRGSGCGYSAALYFFGRELYKELKVPVGLIAASVSGCRIEPFFVPTEGSPSDVAKSDVYNGMIHPLVPFAMRGVVWYQGEANVQDGLPYDDMMKNLIAGWRRAWQQGDFPFYYVQLSAAAYGEPFLLPRFREKQAAVLAVPNTGMAATTDVSSYPDCHSPNKQAVGKRLALWALANTYGRKELVYSGPVYKAMRVQGTNIRVAFDHLGSGLAVREGKPTELTWFEIAGPNKAFVKAAARIDGNSVLTSSPQVPQPVAVRFGWHERAVPNLINKEGLPALPFRTDR